MEKQRKTDEERKRKQLEKQHKTDEERKRKQLEKKRKTDEERKKKQLEEHKKRKEEIRKKILEEEKKRVEEQKKIREEVKKDATLSETKTESSSNNNVKVDDVLSGWQLGGKRTRINKRYSSVLLSWQSGEGTSINTESVIDNNNMKSIYLMGGLGNQLFQIFHLIAYCLRYNYNYNFLYLKELKLGTVRPTYWDNFLKHLKKFTRKRLPRLPRYKEKDFEYKEVPKLDDDVMFLGYYQSYKYFIDQYKKIVKLIKLDDFKRKIKSDNNLDYENIISLHFRIGDYINIQDHHPLMSIEYYKNALNKIQENANKSDWTVLYFNQKEDDKLVDDMIKNLKSEYPNLTFTQTSHELEDWEQMLQMSLCHHNIIANSTFSWWGAYFNDAFEDKIVCYPSVWFGTAKENIIVKDLFPESWDKIL